VFRQRTADLTDLRGPDDGVLRQERCQYPWPGLQGERPGGHRGNRRRRHRRGRTGRHDRGQVGQRVGGVFARGRERDHRGIRKYRRARLAQIGEARHHRLVHLCQQDMAGALELRHGLLGIELQPREAGQASAVLEAGRECLGENRDGGGRGDAAQELTCSGADRAVSARATAGMSDSSGGSKRLWYVAWSPTRLTIGVRARRAL
jgi:hypothetical protein